MKQSEDVGRKLISLMIECEATEFNLICMVTTMQSPQGENKQFGILTIENKS